MGRKPIFSFAGLFLAGLALTGCHSSNPQRDLGRPWAPTPQKQPVQGWNHRPAQPGNPTMLPPGNNAAMNGLPGNPTPAQPQPGTGGTQFRTTVPGGTNLSSNTPNSPPGYPNPGHSINPPVRPTGFSSDMKIPPPAPANNSAKSLLDKTPPVPSFNN